MVSPSSHKKFRWLSGKTGEIWENKQTRVPSCFSLWVRQMKHPGVRGPHLQLTSRRAETIRHSVCTCFGVPLWFIQICCGKCAFTLCAFYFTVSESTSHLLCVTQIWLTSRECWISKTWNRPTYGEPYTCQWFGVEYCSSDINTHKGYTCAFLLPQLSTSLPLKAPLFSGCILRIQRSLRHNWIDFCVTGRRAGQSRRKDEQGENWKDPWQYVFGVFFTFSYTT